MQHTFFEGREVKPYGEYVPTADLIVGRVYFKVGFLDEDMALPEMQALVFLGKDLSPRLPGSYFQDAPSHVAGEHIDVEDWVSASEDIGDDADGRHWVSSDDVVLEWQKPRKHSGVYEFDGALNVLLSCSLRRRSWDGTIRVREVEESEDPNGS